MLTILLTEKKSHSPRGLAESDNEHFSRAEQPNCFPIALRVWALFRSLLHSPPPGLFLLLLLVFVVVVIIFLLLPSILPGEDGMSERARRRTANLTSRSGLTITSGRCARAAINLPDVEFVTRAKTNVVGSIHQISRRKIAAGKQIMVLRHIRGRRLSVACCVW